MYIDGKLVIHATGLILRTEEGPDGRVQGLHFQTFFGGACGVLFSFSPCCRLLTRAPGNSPEWASPKDQRAWFANVSGAILRARTQHDEL